MKKAFVLSILLCFCVAVAAQEPQHKLVQFQMALLQRGPKPIPEGLESSPLRKEHIAYIHSLMESGQVIIAGPISGDPKLAGVLIFRTQSADDARNLANGDPFVKAGYFTPELHPWWAEDVMKKTTTPDKLTTAYIAFLVRGEKWTPDLAGIYLGGSPISHWKQLVNCTIFGYYGAVKASETEYALFQGNRFVHTGGGTYYHSIYISSNDPFPGPAGTATQHNIVDNNLFVAGGDGYAVHFWHNNHTNIITRNFVATHGYGIVHDGSDALVANNLLWRTTNEAMWMPGTHEYIVNNVFGAHAYFVGSSSTNTARNNAFEPGDGALGTGIINLTLGQETAQLGLSAAAIDAAIATIDTAFNGSVDAIFANTTIEPAFATLKLTVPSGSPLYRTGSPWFGATLNLGPDSLAPTTVDDFWTAFRALGLKEYDSNGNVLP